MNIYRVDLNLLGSFQAILKTQSVSAAAELYGITQPAMSNALRRLRDLFGDPLFVQTQKGMQPTPFALSIAQKIDSILMMSKEVFEFKTIFNPLESNQSFRIHLSDLGQYTFLPKLFEKLRILGPNIKIEAITLESDQIYHQLCERRIDFAVGNLSKLSGQGIRSEQLITERFVVICRKDHPILAKNFDIACYLKSDHAVISTSSHSHKIIEDYLDKHHANVLLKTSNIIALPQILKESNMLTTTHLYVAKQLSTEYELVILPIPIALSELDVPISLFWQSNIHYDAAHTWLRSVIQSLYRTI